MAVSVSRQIASIRKSAEKMDAAAPAKVGAASPGDCVRQGDLYLVALASMPAGKASAERQLAEGTTQGSRHIAEGDCEVVIPSGKTAVINEINRLVPASRKLLVPGRDEVLIGPAIRCKGDVTITHPEHGHRSLLAGSFWVSVFQRSFAEEVRRVQD